jgi:hypothetical protein
MYNRILRRPMFKRGGASHQAQGTGITSGLDQPRRRYEDGTPFGELIETAKETNVLPGDVNNTGFMRGMSTMGAYDPDNPRTIGQMIYDASTAKSKYIDPIEKANKERAEALANEEIRQAGAIEEQELVNQGKLDVVAAEALAKSGGKFMVLEVEKKLVELNTRKQEIDKELKLNPDNQDLINEKENIMLSLNQLQKNIDILSSMSPDAIDDMREEFRTKIHKERTLPNGQLKPEFIEKYGVLITTPDGEPVLKDGKKQYERYDEQDISEADIQTYLVDFYTNLGYGRKKEATGGRVGLANSYPGTVEQASMTETMDTPQGDMSVSETETINQAPGDGQTGQKLTFDELRARLPASVGDDIVNLLATSEEALLQFANIRTQQDVDKFNLQYKVDLSLPEEA